MRWQEIRGRYPKQWLLVEAMTAHSHGGRRVLDRLAFVSTFSNSVAAMERYV